eukprot:COSAG06_NODE_25067_length_646_cov_0.910420_1_plen_64_part_10
MNRVIEIGPAATLRNMAARTLASGEFGDAAARELLFWDRDDENVFYEVRETRSSFCARRFILKT